MSRWMWVIVGMWMTTLSAMTIPFSTVPVHTEANRVPDLVSLDEPKNMPSPLDTRIYLWYDLDNLYVDFFASADSTFQAGTFAPRDYSNGGDMLRIQVLTCPNDKFVYGFYAFPLGTLQDVARTDLNNSNSDWNSRYSYTTEVSDSLWHVLMTIPFHDLRILGKPPYRWSVNLLRTMDELEPHSQYGYPQTDTDHTWSHYLSLLMPVTLEHPVHKANNYRISTSTLGSMNLMTDRLDLSPDKVGVNIEYKPFGSMSVKGAVNPDFSEVPPDDEEDTSNLQYAQYLSENRFFFIEDLDAFDIDEGYLYTRTIAQPEYAIKATGNTQHYTYALFTTRADKIVNDYGELVARPDQFTVAGLRPHTRNMSLQIDLQNRRNEDLRFNASTLYLKPKWEIGNRHTLYATLLLTDDLRPGQDRRQGNRFAFEHQIKFKDFSTGYDLVSCTRDFAPAIASPGTDQNNGFHSASYWTNYFNSDEGDILEYREFNTNGYLSDYSGDDLGYEYTLNTQASINFTNDINISAWAGKYRSRYSTDHGYRMCDTQRVGGSLGYSKWDEFFFGGSLACTRTFFYGLDSILPRDTASLWVRGDLAPYFTYAVTYYHYHWYHFPAPCSYDDIFNIANLNLTLNLSRKLFFTSGLRYNDQEYDNYIQHPSGKVETLFWRDLHAGAYATLRYDHSENCRLYLGFNGGLEAWNDDPDETLKTVWFKINSSI